MGRGMGAGGTRAPDGRAGGVSHMGTGRSGPDAGVLGPERAPAWWLAAFVFLMLFTGVLAACGVLTYALHGRLWIPSP
jgi:hypothetical protein